MSTYDITYCVRPCSNMQCKRNIKHLDGLDIRLPISQAYFDNCEEWMVEMTGKSLFDGRKIINIQQYETCKHIWQKVEATTLKGKEYYRCIKCKIWREKNGTRKSN